MNKPQSDGSSHKLDEIGSGADNRDSEGLFDSRVLGSGSPVTTIRPAGRRSAPGAARRGGFAVVHALSAGFFIKMSFRDLLETFPNPYPQRDYSIETICPEFTSLCPKTGQPDFGTLTLTYVPEKLCYELKSLKLYLQQYRNHGAFYEAVTNQILDDLVAVTQPRSMTLIGAFTPRGGIRTNVTVSYVAGNVKSKS